MLPIKGLQKTSLIDFPPYTSSVIFIGGCNFRCGYCQNFDLVLNYKDMPGYREKDVCDFLQKRNRWVEAVVITGGEPTLYNELIDFMRELKKLNLKIKLDTNGTNPDLMWDMMDEGLLDYVAMDIKAPLEMYEKVSVFPVDTDKIKKSVSLIMNSGVDYEFRTTILPDILGKDEIIEMARWVSGARRFSLQPFRATQGLLDKSFESKKGYTKEELSEIKEMIRPYANEVIVRDY
ncbi:MAG: anaerobic ribonucleoside-triphosphate reductase activating protein [Candidatus Nanoarchaeia archaeon]